MSEYQVKNTIETKSKEDVEMEKYLTQHIPSEK